VRDLLARKESVAAELKAEARQIQSVRDTRAAAFRSFFLKSWKSWIGLAMIVYLLPSISFSAVIARWDAVRGRRLLIGNWGIPEVIVYSDKAIVGLPNNPYRKINVEGGYAYMWLGLLANTKETYYFIDLKYVAPFYIPPPLYVVPKSSDVHISLVLQPNNVDAPSERLEDPVAITETPMPSLMPTNTPTRALIPTSRPIQTLTNSPTP
jgi:hypothetical protein